MSATISDRRGRPEHTPEELKAILDKYKDPAYLEKALDGVAEVLLDELFPKDNEIKAPIPITSFHRGKRNE